ncbi:response regulator [Paramagnetospirillum caucaseum]|uniref:diguanylate cyclase n=1 Tax=Paramagnetospirillum caucaseum TaxID=1244869 RepID=M2Y6X7_9PROT|nr:GGDEF domain-containing protein [Paramagnetospirillum caucaseum]EME68811.1 response regulator [Paramagnetospirillum caucaseum]
MRDLVARVMDSRLAALLSQWRRDGTEAADPVARFAAHAEHLLMIEAEGGANRYAHYGRAFAECFGNDLTGQVIDLLPPDILPADRRFMLEFEYGFVRRTARPLWRSYTALFGQDLPQTWQRLVLPAGNGRLVVGAYPVEGTPSGDSAEALLRLVIDRVPVVLGDDGGIADMALSLGAFCDTSRHMAELEVLATRDPLTETSNRRHFEQLAGLELDHARRMGRSFALLALDIDHFKRINDTWGHAAGDAALKAFADSCRLGLREYDILGRVGGEEFAVALPNTGPDGARVIAERLRAAVAELVIRPAKGQMSGLTVSIGIAQLREADLTIATLLERADRALYRAKNAGRNRVVSEE